MARRNSEYPQNEEEGGRVSRPKRPKLVPTKLRIIAGFHGGRRIIYNGDPVTRPMKEKTREAVFSLLGGYLYDRFVVDLFGGTGILAFEAISRGATQGVILELSRSAVGMILDNLRVLNLGDALEVHNVDTLRWLRSLPQQTAVWPTNPWVVFCCPPYRMWKSEGERLTAGLSELYSLSPSGSLFVCETEMDYELAAALPEIEWDVRTYPPAHIAVAVKD